MTRRTFIGTAAMAAIARPRRVIIDTDPEIAGKTHIPAAAGADRPLVRRLITATYAHGENGLGGIAFPEPTTKPVSETATQLIRRLVHASPHQIGIVAIGPLTNIATAFREGSGTGPA